VEGSARRRIARSASRFTIVTCTAWRTLGWLGAFPTLVGGHYSLGATFLGSSGDLILRLVSPRMHASPQTLSTVFTHCGSASHLGWQRSGTVSWVLCDYSGAHHPCSPVITLGIRPLRKKERKPTQEDSLFRRANLRCLRNVSASTVPQGAAPLPTSCNVSCLPMLSCLSLRTFVI